MFAIIFTGPDRVGKTTNVESVINRTHELGIKSEKLHSAGPRPRDNGYYDQYLLELEKVKPGTQVVILDRFYAECSFYERYRRHNFISHDVSYVEKKFIDLFSDGIYLFWIQPEWTDKIIKRHKEEILGEINCVPTQWYLDYRLEQRRVEHFAFTPYMEQYWFSPKQAIDHKFKIFTEESQDIVLELIEPVLQRLRNN